MPQNVGRCSSENSGGRNSDGWNSDGFRAPVQASPLAVLIALSGTFTIGAQAPRVSTLPASAPTTGISPSQLPSANPQVASSQASHSEVSWDGNTLQVIATNASLNRLLQEIGKKTNLQITGSAPEEKIFGTYGPGKLEDVLSDLLDGLSVNMLFVDRPGTQTKQLMLTARSGGPTISPAAAQNNAPDVAQNGPSQFPPSGDPSRNNPPPFPPANDSAQERPQFTPSTAPPSSENPASTGDAPASSTRTPQQIFEQLQRLRQQANGQR